MNFSGGNVNGVYAQAYHAIMGHGLVVPSRNGDTHELNPGIFEVERPTERLVTCYGRPVNVAFALAEVLWILQGRQDVEMLKFYNARIDQWSDDGLSFNAPYGHRLRIAHGFDQIADVIRNLQDDPGSRQAVLNVWHPESDRAYDDHGNKNITADRACNVLCTMKIRDGSLNWLQIVRSNDHVWGVPYNFMQWTHIQEFIARRVGVEVGRYVHVADSLHVYDFNKPTIPVTRFDLYGILGAVHAPMKADGNAMMKVYQLEEDIRNASNPHAVFHHIMRSSDTIGSYWVSVLTLLLAHRYYKDGDNENCISVLSELQDPVYFLAQAKFYWLNRWQKGNSDIDIQSMDQLAVEALGGSWGADSVGSLVARKEAAGSVLAWLQDLPATVPEYTASV